MKRILFALTSIFAMAILISLTDKKQEKIIIKPQEKTIKWEVTEQEANTIIGAIQELPAKVANPLTQKLIMQAQAQISDTTKKK